MIVHCLLLISSFFIQSVLDFIELIWELLRRHILTCGSKADTLKGPVSRVDRPDTGPFHQMAPKESIIPAYVDDVYILTNYIVSWGKEV